MRDQYIILTTANSRQDGSNKISGVLKRFAGHDLAPNCGEARAIRLFENTRGIQNEIHWAARYPTPLGPSVKHSLVIWLQSAKKIENFVAKAGVWRARGR
jgi:hypothetical protein